MKKTPYSAKKIDQIMRGGKLAKKKSEILFSREQQDCLMMSMIPVILANTRKDEQMSNSVSTDLNKGQNCFRISVFTLLWGLEYRTLFLYIKRPRLAMVGFSNGRDHSKTELSTI